jgi:glucose/arabinose dehydrogenase
LLEPFLTFTVKRRGIRHDHRRHLLLFRHLQKSGRILMLFRPRMKPARLMTIALGTMAFAGPALAQTVGNTSNLKHAVVLSDLKDPWDMAFLADGTMFFTEKCKGLSILLPSGDVKALLGMTASEGYASTADDLFCEGQAGMMGVAVDPDFANNRRIYVYSTSSMSSPQTNRLMRLEVSDDFSSVSNRTDIVDDVPYKVAATDHPFGGPGAHNGGRVQFNPGDGYLYLTTGDNHNGEVPQSPTMMGSKVLRIDTDGNAAAENAPPEGFDKRTYTYGHRNVQGIAFNPSNNTAIVAEHGPWHSDEITVLVNGGNAGWDPRPNMAGRADCPDNYCGYSPNQLEGMNRYERASFMPMTDLKSYPDAMQPMWDNNGWSQGTGSSAFLVGDQWGDWNGNMVVGIMGIGFGGTPIGQRIDVIELSDDGMSVVDVTEMTLPMEPGRFRSLVLGPDGSLYAAVDEGSIHKLTP